MSNYSKMPLTNYRILIVDDEEDLRRILSEDLAHYGATVYTAKNGQEAFELATAIEPHVILSDVRMPGGDGVELLRRIRELFKAAPPHFFLLTGFADISPEVTQLLGSHRIVSKPFILKELRERVIALFE